MAKKVVFEIEDSKGNTFLAFEIDVEQLAKSKEDGTDVDRAIVRTKGCDIADVDHDYIFESEAPLIRIQQD